MKKISYGIMMIAGIISIVLIIMYDSKKEIILNEKKISKLKKEEVAMMYETEAGSGEYISSNNTTWPEGDYVFNDKLSKCEQGSVLSWNETTKSVVVKGSISDKCYIYFDVEQKPLTDYIKSLSISDGINGLYLHDEDLANGANDGSLRYAGGDYELTSKATSEGYNKIVSSSTETGNLINFYCNNSKEYVGASCTTLDPAPYYTVGASSTQYSTYKEALEAATTEGYLTKDNIKNFVCFGSDEETCPTDNLYRIIGVFDNRVKLIKYDYATKELLGEDGDFYQRQETIYYSGRKEGDPKVIDKYFGNKKGSKLVNGTNYRNVWSISKLNTINLNVNYINNIGEKWSSMITETTYKVGGNDYAEIERANVKTAYQNEITNPNKNIEENYKARIGLMYVSDYGYAVKPNNWDINLERYNLTKENNWMYMGYDDWTILRVSSNTNHAFRVYSTGYVKYASVSTALNASNYASGVRPVFYLSNEINYISGEGTKTNPYRIG